MQKEKKKTFLNSNVEFSNFKVLDYFLECFIQEKVFG